MGAKGYEKKEGRGRMHEAVRRLHAGPRVWVQRGRKIKRARGESMKR